MHWIRTARTSNGDYKSRKLKNYIASSRANQPVTHSKLQGTNKLVGQRIISLVQNWPKKQFHVTIKLSDSMEKLTKYWNSEKNIKYLTGKNKAHCSSKGHFTNKELKATITPLKEQAVFLSCSFFFPADVFIDFAPYLHRRISTEFHQCFYKKCFYTNNFVSLRNWIIIYFPFTPTHSCFIFRMCMCMHKHESWAN